MKFNVGDRVHLNTPQRYASGTEIPKCTKGIVEELYRTGESCLVRFDGIPEARRVLEQDLDPV